MRCLKNFPSPFSWNLLWDHPQLRGIHSIEYGHWCAGVVGGYNTFFGHPFGFFFLDFVVYKIIFHRRTPPVYDCLLSLCINWFDIYRYGSLSIAVVRTIKEGRARCRAFFFLWIHLQIEYKDHTQWIRVAIIPIKIL